MRHPNDSSLDLGTNLAFPKYVKFSMRQWIFGLDHNDTDGHKDTFTSKRKSSIQNYSF